MTVGLVGFGAIGRAVARLLLNFGATVLYYDPVQASSAVESELQVTRRPLDELLAASDLVSLHLPLMKETAGLIDAPRKIGRASFGERVCQNVSISVVAVLLK